MAIVNWTETIRKEMEDMVALGITSFKTFMAYKGVLGIDDAQLLSCLRRARELQALVSVHAVNGDVLSMLANEFADNGHTEPKYHAQSQPPLIEGEAAHRAIILARLAKQGL
jgi:dihydropyrimidinase